MTNYTFFKTGTEWAPGSYIQFGPPVQLQGTQLTTFFGQPAVDGTLFTAWNPEGPSIPLEPNIPGPGGIPPTEGGTQGVRRLIPQRRKGKNLENNVRNALTIILTEYYF